MIFTHEIIYNRKIHSLKLLYKISIFRKETYHEHPASAIFNLELSLAGGQRILYEISIPL